MGQHLLPIMPPKLEGKDAKPGEGVPGEGVLNSNRVGVEEEVDPGEGVPDPDPGEGVLNSNRVERKVGGEGVAVGGEGVAVGE